MGSFHISSIPAQTSEKEEGVRDLRPFPFLCGLRGEILRSSGSHRNYREILKNSVVFSAKKLGTSAVRTLSPRSRLPLEMAASSWPASRSRSFRSSSLSLGMIPL
eukprot:405984-Prorocentrum_lima.AAC.1